MAYGDFKDLTGRTVSDKILRDKAFNIANNLQYDDNKEVLLQWFVNFSIKKTSGSVIKNKNISNKELAEKLQNHLLENSRKEK